MHGSRSRLVAVVALAVAALAVAAGSAGAQEPALDWANYEVVTLTGDTGEAMDLAVLPGGRVLHTAREGALRLTDPATGVTTVTNQFDVYLAGEQGLSSVTLDPDFATNRWVYLYYAPRLETPPGSAPNTLPAGETEAYWDRWKGYDVLSRFKWDAATDSLDLSTEQQILRVDTNRGGGAHHAGDVAFDEAGNLYLSTGDNTGADACGAGGYAPINDSPGANPACDARRGAGNTNDLRGKILRIAVNEDGSYSIPDGNLFPESEDTAGQDAAGDLHHGRAQPVPDPDRRRHRHADLGRLRPRRRSQRPTARADGPGRVERGAARDGRAQQRLALLHRRQPALQRLGFRELGPARVVRLLGAEEHVAQQHGPRRAAAGGPGGRLVRRPQLHDDRA